jgi:hypothetical protein
VSRHAVNGFTHYPQTVAKSAQFTSKMNLGPTALPGGRNVGSFWGCHAARMGELNEKGEELKGSVQD